MTPAMYPMVLNIVYGTYEPMLCVCEMAKRLRVPPAIMLTIPDEYRTPTPSFDNYRVTPQNEVAAKYAQAWVAHYLKAKYMPPPMLFGHVGRGKSRLLWTVLMEIKSHTDAWNYRKYDKEMAVIKRGGEPDLHPTYDRFYPKIISMARFAEALKDRMNYRSDLSEYRKSLVAADVLVIDDIGAENPTEFVREELYLLVDDRVLSRKPLLAACNFAASEMRNWLGDRISSRLEGACQILEIAGDDMRKVVRDERSAGAR